MSSSTRDDHIVVAADVGQSGTRVAVSDSAGCRVVPARPLQYGENVMEALGEILLDALADGFGGRPIRFDTLCAGVTGLNGRAPQPADLLVRLHEAAGVTHVVLADDSVTSYLGALGIAPGAVVAAGTGAVTLAADGRGAYAHVDGAGHLIGDAGGGYWIGRAGLESAWRAADGRHGSAALLAAAVEHLGELRSLPADLAKRADRVEMIAGFAKVVASVATAGDELAMGIWAAAADELAASAAAALAVSGLASKSVPVSAVGSLTAAGELLLAPFREALARRCPTAQYVAPQGTALDGALSLAGGAEKMFGPLVASARTPTNA